MLALDLNVGVPRPFTGSGVPSGPDGVLTTEAGDLLQSEAGQYLGFERGGGGGGSTYSVEFNGTDQYAKVGSVDTWNMLSMWVNLGTGTYRRFIGCGSGISNRLLFFYYSGAIYAGNGTWSYTLNNGQWYHLALAVNLASGKAELYVNGVSQSQTGSTIGTISARNQNFDIAVHDTPYVSSQTATYPGKIDEIALWDTQLSAADVTSIYNSGVPNNLQSASSYDTDRTSNLLHWWRMGDGTEAASGSTVYDEQGTADATLYNSPTFSTDVPT